MSATSPGVRSRVCGLRFKLMRPLDGRSAHNAIRSLRVCLAPAVAALKDCDTDPAVNLSVTEIDFQNLFLQILVLEIGLLAQQFPHRLTNQRQSFDLSLGIAQIFLNPPGLAIDLLGRIRQTSDIGMLICLPNHDLCSDIHDTDLTVGTNPFPSPAVKANMQHVTEGERCH